MVSSALNRLAPIDFTRYIDRLTERFTGREWLFEQIDGWLKQGNEQFYLLTGEPGVGKSAIAAKLTQIRSDIAAYHFCRAGDVETVRPGRVLRSLAAQLGKTLPHYGEALAKTIDPIHLRIDVNINIESLSNSQVTGIYIENLKESDPRNELEILLRAPLAALPDLYAEHNEPLPTLKILLIDSLDEAVTTTGRDNMATLLAALSQADGLPSWIGFILTARPDLRVLQQFKLMKLYKLEALLAQNLEDIERYVGDRVEELVVPPESKFQARLEQAELSAETLVHTVKDLSNGNFLYTRLLVDGIAAEELSLKNLSALPRTLNEVYQRFLRHRCPFRKWSDRYQPILGTLTVTQEAISQEQLVKFTGVDSKPVQDALGVLQQFLDEAEDEQGQKRYAIFHQSLREYLLDRKSNHDFWCDAKEQHDSIIDCYEKESESWQELRQIDLYGLCNLVQHLVQANQVDELHRLLSREKDGRNAWFDAKDRIGETAGFLADVELAWSQADEAYDREAGKSIGLQCQYALIKASINKLAAIPPSMMVALVKHKYWTSAQALAYILQIPEPQKRYQSLLKLATYMPDSELLRKKLFQRTFQAVEAISDEVSRAKAFRKMLATKFPPELLPEVLTATQLIKHEECCVKVLKALVTKLPPELLPTALEIARSIQNEQSHIEALMVLATRLPLQLFPEVIQAVKAVQAEWSRTELLKKLITKLPSQLLPEALQVAKTISSESYRFKALIALMYRLPTLLPEVFETALAIQTNEDRAEALIALTDKIPTALPNALEAIKAISYEGTRAEILIKLATKVSSEMPSDILNLTKDFQEDLNRAKVLRVLAVHLPSEFLSHLLQITRGIQNETARVEVLIALGNDNPTVLLEAFQTVKAVRGEGTRVEMMRVLAGKLPSELLPEALQIARALQREEERAEMMRVLADKLPSELLSEALQIAKDFQDEGYRTKVLGALATKLPSNLLPEVFQATQALKIEKYRIKLLSVLADKLPLQLLLEALQLAQVIRDERNRAKVLTTLSERNPIVFSEALQVIKVIETEGFRADALSKLVDKLPLYLLPETFQIANDIECEGSRTQVLRTLVNKFPSILPQTLKSAQALQNEYYRADILCVLVDELPVELFPEALQLAKSIQDKNRCAQVLVTLATKFPTVFSEALEAVRTIQCKEECAKALSTLAHHFPIVVPEALRAIQHLDYVFGGRTKTLKMLVARLPLKLLPEILEVAQDIPDKLYYADILIALTDAFPNIAFEVFKATHAMQDEWVRSTILEALVDKLPTELLPDMLEVARSIQDIQYRGRVLSVLVDRVPTILLEALYVVRAIPYELSRAEALSSLVDKAPEVLPEALEAARIVQDEGAKLGVEYGWLRSRVLNSLVAKLPHELLPKALEATRAIHHQEDRGEALATLSARLTPDLLVEAFQSAKEIQDEGIYARLLSALAPKLPSELLPEVLQVARNMNWYRASTLNVLADRIPTILPEVLDAVLAIPYWDFRVRELSILVDKLPPNLLLQVIQAAQTSQNDWFCTEVLTLIANKLPMEFLPEAFRVAQAIQHDASRAKAISSITPRLVELPSSQLFSLFRDAMHTLSVQSRSILLKDLNVLSPIVFSLSDQLGAAMVANVIQNVARWWP